MTKKIVAIGGGENGRSGPNGMRYPYELANQDKEIITRAQAFRRIHLIIIAFADALVF